MTRSRMLPVQLLLPLAAVALLGTACGGSTPTLRQSVVEDRISSGLEAKVGQKPDDISCPGDLKGEVGTKMQCTLTAGSDKLGVSVKVTSVEGKKVNFSYEVAQMSQGSQGKESS